MQVKSINNNKKVDMKSKMMTEWQTIVDKIVGDYNIYSSVMITKMEFPAIILTPSVQVFSGALSTGRTYQTKYEWQLIILTKVDDYEGENDKMVSAMDDLWYFTENIQTMLGVNFVEASPFGHYKDNKELFAIEYKINTNY